MLSSPRRENYMSAKVFMTPQAANILLSRDSPLHYIHMWVPRCFYKLIYLGNLCTNLIVGQTPPYGGIDGKTAILLFLISLTFSSSYLTISLKQ